MSNNLQLGPVNVPPSYRWLLIGVLIVIAFLLAVCVYVLFNGTPFLREMLLQNKLETNRQLLDPTQIENYGKFARREDVRTYRNKISIQDKKGSLAIFMVSASGHSIDTKDDLQADISLKSTYPDGEFCGLDYNQEKDHGSHFLRTTATCFVMIEDNKDFIIEVRTKNFEPKINLSYSYIFISP
jgi:hypothetical protein